MVQLEQNIEEDFMAKVSGVLAYLDKESQKAWKNWRRRDARRRAKIGSMTKSALKWLKEQGPTKR